jgi:hypothetical protein
MLLFFQMMTYPLWFLCGQDMAETKLAWKLKEKSAFELLHNERVNYILMKLDNLMQEYDKMSVCLYYEFKDDLQNSMAKMAEK